VRREDIRVRDPKYARVKKQVMGSAMKRANVITKSTDKSTKMKLKYPRVPVISEFALCVRIFMYSPEDF
jgi:hypothetical protein